jgi:hypothetical protein
MPSRGRTSKGNYKSSMYLQIETSGTRTNPNSLFTSFVIQEKSPRIYLDEVVVSLPAYLPSLALTTRVPWKRSILPHLWHHAITHMRKHLQGYKSIEDGWPTLPLSLW